MRPLVILLILALTSTAYAQEITPLREGEAAPFTGMLFPSETAVKWRQRIELLETRLRLEVSSCEDISRVRLETLRGTLRLRTEQYTADVDQLMESRTQALRPKLLDSPLLWLVVGVIIGGGLVAVATRK